MPGKVLRSVTWCFGAGQYLSCSVYMRTYPSSLVSGMLPDSFYPAVDPFRSPKIKKKPHSNIGTVFVSEHLFSCCSIKLAHLCNDRFHWHCVLGQALVGGVWNVFVSLFSSLSSLCMWACRIMLQSWLTSFSAFACTVNGWLCVKCCVNISVLSPPDYR